MNASIINFMNDGTIHPTRLSHWAALSFPIRIIYNNICANTYLWGKNDFFIFDEKKSSIWSDIFFFGDIFFFQFFLFLIEKKNITQKKNNITSVLDFFTLILA